MTDVEAPEHHSVTLPSGAPYEVLSEREADYLENLTKKYMDTLVFEHPSDLQDLDLIVQLETHNWRFNRMLSIGRDEYGTPVPMKQIQEFIKSNSTEIRRLKDVLGFDKKTRDRTQGDGSTAEFIARLKHAGAQMNILRCAQLDKGIELSMQLRTLTTVYFNGDDEERAIYGCTAEDILRWIAEVFDPEMQAVDDYFKQHEQKIWIRRM